jgi:hypothetical protein
MLGRLDSGIRTGDYRVVPLAAGHGPAEAAGNSRTIVIGHNENGKTVYVPADRLSGPDKRTIDVNCSDCEVVVVGDSANGGREPAAYAELALGLPQQQQTRVGGLVAAVKIHCEFLAADDVYRPGGPNLSHAAGTVSLTGSH